MSDAELRLGRWQEVLADIEAVDVLATDPPYSERTHTGFRSGSAIEELSDGATRNRLTYAPMSDADIPAFVGSWAPRVKRWALLFGDDVSVALWRSAWDAAGWVTFAPVAWVKMGSAPRLQGDGPASAVEYIAVARPRRNNGRHHGSTPGFYVVDCVRSIGKDKDNKVIGSKDVAGLRRLLRDYSRPGDVIADPFGGSASIGQACIELGRRYIGSEMDPETWAKGQARLAKAGPDPVLTDRWAEPRRQTSLDFRDGSR